MTGVIITCNAGSANTKLAVFNAENISLKQSTKISTKQETINWLRNISENEKILAIGHRVVHGGDIFSDPILINAEKINQLRNLIPLAPLHQPATIDIITETIKLYPNVPQIACFDTAFHYKIPEIEKKFPLPKKYYDSGIKRYGFHGISYQYISSVLSEYAGKKAAGKIIVAHLGGGASACAIKELKSIATTMGFSTLDGLMMSSRCGALDVGVILHFLQEKNMSADEISSLLYKNSGLLGVSGISANMKELLASNKTEAKTAIELYCYLAAKQICSLLAPLGGLDAMVFTGGIGEHSEEIRKNILAYLSFLGKFPVYVIPTNEEFIIATSCKEYISV